MEATAVPTPHIRHLNRSRSNRYLGGVAGGLGEYFGIDPVIVRILFVALCFAGGFGFAFYVMAWLFVPAEGTDQSIVGRRFASGRRARTLRNLFLAAVVGFVALIAVAAGALGIVAASSGVPLRGGVGDRSLAPTSVQEMDHTYRLAAGNMDLDLSHVRLPEGITRVDASVVAGHLLVTVPRHVAVSVDAHAGAGDVTVFGRHDSGRDASRSVSGEPGRQLVLTAKAGIGDVEVVRG